MGFSFSNDGACAGAVVAVGLGGFVNILRRGELGNNSLAEEQVLFSVQGGLGFGWDLDVSADGDKIAIGSPDEGAAFVYARRLGERGIYRWVCTHRFEAPEGEEKFGWRIFFTTQDAHAVRVFAEKEKDGYEYLLAD